MSYVIWKFNGFNRQISGWLKNFVTFKFQKPLWNIWLAIKGSQFRNYQMNNSIKNQIPQKINHSTTLWINCTMWLPLFQKNMSGCYNTTWVTYRYAKQLRSPGVQDHNKLLKIRILNLSQNDVLEIWSTNFQLSTFKNTWSCKHFNNYVVWQTIVWTKYAFIFLELPFLQCNENLACLFKNIHNKEKCPFCLKSNIFVCNYCVKIFLK